MSLEIIKCLHIERNIAHAKKATKNVINLYNEIRLHLSLDFKIPNMVYKLTA